MADNVIGAVIHEAVQLVVPPIERQFNYLCCFTTNINNLEQEAKDLDDAEEGINVKVATALNDVQIIAPQVETWLAKSKDIKDQKTAILDRVPNVSGCLKLRARFCLSRRAKKTTDRMKELRDECSKFDVVSLPGPPPAREAVELRNAYEFESRKEIEEGIMTVLRGGDVSMIGICGMGGLGKTTMAKRIMNRVLKENVFKEAVIAVVSQQVNKREIQIEIGGSLGLNLKEETSEAGRKKKLHTRLSGTERILLVLDDVWQRIDLEEFGIPQDSKGCTILITSRNRDTLIKMNVQKENEFGMEILKEDEARFLFREKAGTCMHDDQLKTIAEGVVKECGGLPIALATVGAVLKDVKIPSIWRDVLRQLRQRDPYIPDFIAEVYTPLKLSYDFLISKPVKSLFLLCCLFPEDAEIPLELLTYFGMGLGIFEGISSLEEMRDSISTSIQMLKSRSLLLDIETSDDHVRMHDVVRDVCIYIAKQEGYVGGNDCPWISLFELFGERTNLPIGLGFPNLRLLFLSDSSYSSEEEVFEFDNAFFEGISDLYVLCIRRYSSLTSLPLTHCLKSLVLDSCDTVETISVVGESLNLEILICRDCRSIEELPLEMKRLNRLKLLELTGCYNLQRIGQGIIRSLSKLEEVKMLDSFNRWKSEEERENAGLRELEALTNLRCLEIEIEDPALVAEMKNFSSKIKRFLIKIGTRPDHISIFHVYDKIMVLELGREEPFLGNIIWMQLLRDVESLKLSGNGASSLDLAKCQNIRWLELTKCETVKNIITTSMADDATASIEHMNLQDLREIEVICDGPISSNSFHNLKELNLLGLVALKQLWKSSSQNIDGPPLFTNLSSIAIWGCDRLCNLGLLSMAGKDCLPQLQELVIAICEMMEQVFLWNKEDVITEDYNCSTKVFSKLKKIVLYYLPNLETFYQGMGAIEFPLLTELSITGCPKLKNMGSNHNSGCSNADTDFSHLLCQPKKVSFGNLKELSLEIPFCGHTIPLSLLYGLEVLSFCYLYGSTSLFSSSDAGNLVNLRKLSILECNSLLKVIEEDEKVVSGTAEMPRILFPKLEELRLHNLPKLVTFCEWKCDVKLPSLREVNIMMCPDMENSSLGFIAAPKLEDFRTDLKNNLETGVHVLFNSLKKLEITDCETPLGHKFCISIFNGLKELTVFDCHGSMNCLFTSSIARSLDSLQLLFISNCKEMVKVIEDDEENEEKVGSGGERTLLFPKLSKLHLDYLPKLVSFCEWKCDIELPSLRDVFIGDCPVLRIFTMGSIAAAPNFKNFPIKYEDIVGDTKDLNRVLQQNMARKEKWQEEMKKMEGGEEEEKTKGEIEVGQN